MPLRSTVSWSLTGAHSPVWLPVWAWESLSAALVSAGAAEALPPGKVVPEVQSAPMTRVSCELAPARSAELGRLPQCRAGHGTGVRRRKRALVRRLHGK